ncbi:MAG: hypothetical protein IJO70_04870 [Lachnospiraceae bacterium]|nr:hypothetical protein [Lachnospiraceae bacterium]
MVHKEMDSIILLHFISRDCSNSNRPCTGYIEKICDQFDSFIASLPESVQEEARAFFYPDGIYTNLKSEDVKTIVDFAPEVNGASKSYYQSAKTAYFCVLMDIGGQRGLKKVVKDSLSLYGYNEGVIEKCIIDALPGLLEIENGAAESDVLKVITRQGYDTVNGYKKRTAGIIRRNIQKYINSSFKAQDIINEYNAGLRNQRKLMFYYGFFYSQSLGVKDNAFSSLTDVGEYAVRENWNELMILWEHQKLKMISQTSVTEINNIPDPVANDTTGFSISYSPYVDIIMVLWKEGKMSNDEYQYIVSRLNVLSRSENIEEEIHAYDEFMSIILVFNSIEEKNEFDEYVEYHIEKLRVDVDKQTQYSYVKANSDAETWFVIHRLRTALVLQGLLQEFRKFVKL